MHEEMEHFLEMEKGTDKSPGTIKLYRRGLEQFSEWIVEEDLEVREVTYRDVKRYLSHLTTETDYAPSTIRGRFSAISQFYADLTENGAEFDDPTGPVEINTYAEKTSRKEQESKEKHIWLETDEVKQLVEHVPPPKVRNKLIVLFQYFTGLRRQELVDIRIQDLDREEREIKIRGKGDENRVAYWHPKADRLLSTWIDRGYRDASPYARDSPYLFVTTSSPQMSASRVSYVVREAAKNAGLQEVLYEDAAGNPQHKITSHTLRHSYAMQFLQDEESTLDELSGLLGHKSVTTTEIYGEMMDERLETAYRRSGPGIDFEF